MSSDYSSFKVVDLKRELKTRCLSTVGNKEELVERLSNYTQSLLGSGSDIDGFGESITEHDILEEDVLGEELDYEDDVLKKSSELSDYSSPTENSSLDLTTDISVNSNSSSLNVTVIANEKQPLPQRESQRTPVKIEKKVHLIRNRSISLLSDTDLKENTKLEENSKNQKISEIKTEPSIVLQTKLSSGSINDRLEQRKRKFGIIQEDSKRAARAARFDIKSTPAISTKKVAESADVLKSRAERFGLSGLPVSDKSKTLETLRTRAERFGSVSSPLLNKLSEEEKMVARKNRFLSTDISVDEKKKLRAERFNISA